MRFPMVKAPDGTIHAISLEMPGPYKDRATTCGLPPTGKIFDPEKSDDTLNCRECIRIANTRHEESQRITREALERLFPRGPA